MYDEDDFAKQLAREKFRHAVLEPIRSAGGDRQQRRDSDEYSNAKKSRKDWDETSSQSSSTAPRFESPFPMTVPNYPPPVLPPQGGWPPMDQMLPPSNLPPQHLTPPIVTGKSDLNLATQPPMLSQRQFLSTLPDRMSESEARHKYEDYRIEFKRQQIYDFFQQHKHEEWFKVKYHPGEEEGRLVDAERVLKRRCHIFLELMKLGRLDSISLDAADIKAIVKLLDAAVILMEGGCTLDLKVLDDDYKSVSNSLADSNFELTKSKRRDEYAQIEKNIPDFDAGSISDSENETEIAINNTPSSTVIEGNTYSSRSDERVPMPLHKTTSIFLRTLAPATTKQEVEMLCSRFSGFRRVALQDPQPEQAFLRRAWVTFSHNVNVRDICWNLSNAKIRNQDIGAIVNSELKQRVRTVTGLTVHRSIAKQDIKNAFKIIQILDRKYNIWNEDAEKDNSNIEFCGFVTKNPVLHNITDYLVDEGSYEEEALLQFHGSNSGSWDEDMDMKSKPGHAEVMLEKDKALLKALDKMLLYLRIVYSIDYYNAIEYSKEDEMPHRCGIIHARSPPPQNRITNNDINDWTNSFEKRIAPMLKSKTNLNTEEMKKLGRKDAANEVEKFLMANMQELGKDKWLCPLSGKKFKSADFVRKHILTKHMDKVEEVKAEAIYFNNYLQDSNRPQLPEHPPITPETSRPNVVPTDPLTPKELYNPPQKIDNALSNRDPFPPPMREPFANLPREMFPPMSKEEYNMTSPRNAFVMPPHLKSPYPPPREGFLLPPNLREPFRPPPFREGMVPLSGMPREPFMPPINMQREPFSPPTNREPFRPMLQPTREPYKQPIIRDPFFSPLQPQFMRPMGGLLREPVNMPPRERFMAEFQQGRPSFRGPEPLREQFPTDQPRFKDPRFEVSGPPPTSSAMARIPLSYSSAVRHLPEPMNSRFPPTYPIRPREDFRPRMRFIGNGNR